MNCHSRVLKSFLLLVLQVLASTQVISAFGTPGTREYSKVISAFGTPGTEPFMMTGTRESLTEYQWLVSYRYSDDLWNVVRAYTWCNVPLREVVALMSRGCEQVEKGEHWRSYII